MVDARLKVGFIGAGNMGQALAGGLVKSGLVPADRVMLSDIDRVRLKEAEDRYGVRSTDDSRGLAEWADMVVLAVKPAKVEDVLKEIKGAVCETSFILSIAAGVKTSRIESILGEVPVVRAMPNTPALVGAGVTAICPGRYAGEREIETACEVLSAAGSVMVVKEDLMDAVTALSGSGPAYFFLMVEAMVEAGIKLGIPSSKARELAVKTMEGSAAMLVQESADARELRRKVTSPGGTTEAAIAFLERNDFAGVLHEAIKKAEARSSELSGD